LQQHGAEDCPCGGAAGLGGCWRCYSCCAEAEHTHDPHRADCSHSQHSDSYRCLCLCALRLLLNLAVSVDSAPKADRAGPISPQEGGGYARRAVEAERPTRRSQDDLGHAELGYHRPAGYEEVQTPVIDGLVKVGVNLDRFCESALALQASSCQTASSVLHRRHLSVLQPRARHSPGRRTYARGNIASVLFISDLAIYKWHALVTNTSETDSTIQHASQFVFHHDARLPSRAAPQTSTNSARRRAARSRPAALAVGRRVI
jgi:hypothetical protein